MWKTQKQPEFEGRDYYYEIKNRCTYLHLLCYFVYQDTSNNALPFQSWSSTCNSLSTHEKQDEIVFVDFHFFIYIFTVQPRKLGVKSAAINYQLISAVNLCWLPRDLHTVMKVNSGVCDEEAPHAGPDARNCCFWRIKGSLCAREETSVIPDASFQHVLPIKQRSEHLLFSIWLTDGLLEK